MMKAFLQPSQVTLETTWRRIPKTAKLAFMTSLATGVLVYLFALTNPLVCVGDALNNIISSSNQVGLGRWSCSWLSALSTDYSMPLVNGVIMLLAVSLLAAIVVVYLEIRSSLLAVVCALVLICYPSVGNTLKYTHLADGYMIAAMLVVLSLYLLDRYRFGWIVSIPMLTLALGTYQAYVSLVIALMFTRAVQLILRPSSDNRALLRLALRYILVVAASLAAYYALVGPFSDMYGIPLSDYQSVDSMGKFSLGTLMDNFLNCYRDFKKEITFLSFRPGFYVNGYANYLYVCLTAGLIVVTYVTGKNKTVLKSVALAALLALSPLLLCSIHIFNPSSVYSLMTYSVACLYLLGIVVLEQLPDVLRHLSEDIQGKAAYILSGRKWMRTLLCLASWVMIICLIVCLYAWTVGINLDYYRAKLDNENMYAQCSLYLQMAEATPGYEKSMPIYVVGSPVDSASISRAQPTLNQPKSYYAFMKFFLGVQMPFGIANSIDDAAYRFAATEAFAQMPTYPAGGCSLVADGNLYIKLSEIR